MYLLLIFYHLTLYILTHLYFIFSLENDVMETSKRCIFSLIFILKCLTKFNLILFYYFKIKNSGLEEGQVLMTNWK